MFLEGHKNMIQSCEKRTCQKVDKAFSQQMWTGLIIQTLSKKIYFFEIKRSKIASSKNYVFQNCQFTIFSREIEQDWSLGQ